MDDVELAELELMYSQRMFNEYDQSTGVGFRRALCSSWMVQAYLPAAHALQEAHHIALLLLLKLLEVLVGTHLEGVLAYLHSQKLGRMPMPCRISLRMHVRHWFGLRSQSDIP